ncbi:PP2C family protein-serine/threonine phosphatase [Phycisphaera mikurensis]|uniref:Putative phosphatase n=1 Tax=Phycisphaera mikurensis (strain NBRC 102666 / KCTC 22515 / FYK2301M01) TaxID=1142394 RepID=I0IJ36_PHYMF|nr:PP2C family protein-serine/threonine phosphatase [Phycisphaera mikurensis]MBB6443121.1 sigma-B regulation protein RsbU (phosphoserine phosphatase) [Phycisphaera mikurensis]BAM05274.1 putative phosphatase [Phycisphaera mikurensis NBRC 102666]
MAPQEEIQKLKQELAEAEAARAEVEARDAKLQREVGQIARIHQALLPDQMPDVAGVRLAVRHAAPNRAGGDYYDVIPLQRDEALSAEASDPWLLIIADASGHGPAAAVIMAMIQAVLHGYRGDARGPGPVMSFVNAEMVKKAVPGSFTTAVLGLLDPRKSTFSYAIAGHHPPLLRREGEPVVELPSEEAGLPLGVAEDEGAGRHEIHPLRPGDAVLLYTDGAIETRNPAGEQFGLGRLKAALEAAAGTPDQQLDAVVGAIDAHRAGGPMEDDRTLLMFQAEATEP